VIACNYILNEIKFLDNKIMSENNRLERLSKFFLFSETKVHRDMKHHWKEKFNVTCF